MMGDEVLELKKKGRICAGFSWVEKESVGMGEQG
jgi:hypothetical protein